MSSIYMTWQVYKLLVVSWVGIALSCLCASMWSCNKIKNVGPRGKRRHKKGVQIWRLFPGLSWDQGRLKGGGQPRRRPGAHGEGVQHLVCRS